MIAIVLEWLFGEQGSVTGDGEQGSLCVGQGPMGNT